MKKSAFNIEFQQKDITSKIVVSLERISEAFKSLLWEYAKVIGLSPIQIQLLIFIAYHKPELCKVSQLADEFNITKPTVSDAVRILAKKGLIDKEYSEVDNRSYTISLTAKGKETVNSTERFAAPVKTTIESMAAKEQEMLYSSLNKLIFNLNAKGVLTIQRMCYGCRFYEKTTSAHFCNLLEKELKTSEIRVDCPEFEGK